LYTPYPSSEPLAEAVGPAAGVAFEVLVIEGVTTWTGITGMRATVVCDVLACDVPPARVGPDWAVAESDAARGPAVTLELDELTGVVVMVALEMAAQGPVRSPESLGVSAEGTTTSSGTAHDP
jgi:hypothetical protein